MTTSLLRVVIADDQRVVREGLAMLIGLLDGIQVVATATDGVEAVDQALLHRPDIVVMDLRMPNLDGAAATARIRAELPQTQVLVLTTYADDDALFPALQAGARGYLTKNATAEEIEQSPVRPGARADPPRPRDPETPRGGQPGRARSRPGAHGSSRWPVRARGRGPDLIAAGLSGPDRPQARPQQRHHQKPHQPHLRQDRRPRPRPSRPLRVRPRTDLTMARPGPCTPQTSCPGDPADAQTSKACQSDKTGRPLMRKTRHARNPWSKLRHTGRQGPHLQDRPSESGNGQPCTRPALITASASIHR
jgi:CheY-like chemotaxis protein